MALDEYRFIPEMQEIARQYLIEPQTKEWMAELAEKLQNGR